MVSAFGFVLGLLLSTALRASASRIPQLDAARRNLVPTRRALSIEARDLWNRALIPQNQVQLDYGICELAHSRRIVAARSSSPFFSNLPRTQRGRVIPCT